MRQQIYEMFTRGDLITALLLMGELRIRLKNHTEVIYDVIERRNVGKTEEFSEIFYRNFTYWKCHSKLQ